MVAGLWVVLREVVLGEMVLGEVVLGGVVGWGVGGAVTGCGLGGAVGLGVEAVGAMVGVVLLVVPFKNLLSYSSSQHRQQRHTGAAVVEECGEGARVVVVC